MHRYTPAFTTLISTLIILGCSTTQIQIQDSEAKRIILKSIEAHGGLDTWNKLEELTYTKKFFLFLENGDVEKEFNQVHDYDIEYGVYTIQNENTDGTIEITTLDKEKYTHQLDGVTTDKPATSLRKSVNSSVYVIGIPFKLLDTGVKLQYEGADQIEGKQVYIVSAEYDPVQNANHSTKDVWWYYFDASSYRVVANKVKTGDHWAWIENLTYDEGSRLLFNKHRKSYRIDSLGNKLYLRAEYFYDDYSLEF